MTYDARADSIGSWAHAIAYWRSLLEKLSREIGEDEAREIVRKKVERDRG